jgi:hypothetical protein
MDICHARCSLSGLIFANMWRDTCSREGPKRRLPEPEPEPANAPSAASPANTDAKQTSLINGLNNSWLNKQIIIMIFIKLETCNAD